jgi:hypothetical protein
MNIMLISETIKNMKRIIGKLAFKDQTTNVKLNIFHILILEKLKQRTGMIPKLLSISENSAENSIFHHMTIKQA